MSLSPATRMSGLSLACNSSASEDHPQVRPTARESPMPDSQHSLEGSDWEVEGEEEEPETNTVLSPTGLKYNTSKLSPKARHVVEGLFNQTGSKDPPQISLELCGVREEDSDSEDAGVFYAFQMHEVVPCSVRIGSRNSGRFSVPKCECPDARYRQVSPCKHLVWLFDRISKQALFDHDPNSELTLTEAGYAEELGDPFDQISQIGLDILAHDLRCDASEPDSDAPQPNATRFREAREIVAAVAGVQDNELAEYRPDLEVKYDREVLIHRGDVGATLFSLILASHSLAEWVRSELDLSDFPLDPFRSIQHRVMRVIERLNTYLRIEGGRSNFPKTRRARAEGPRDVSWACCQIQRSLGKIEKLVSRGSSPLSSWARASAARALVSILKAVVEHRLLYDRLVGNQDCGFVFSSLDMLADQSQFIDALEEIMDKIGVLGAPPSYVTNMRHLILRMRSHKTEDVPFAGGSGTQRSETPVPDEPSPGAVQPPAPGRSTSVRFLTPEMPASVMGRGGRGKAGRGRGSTRGAKRSVSEAGPSDSSGGTKKKARES
ncbi:uncharacterized protein C8A04DRAFT_11242 [Dichotomopilus funicola]|uniref:SWIM-type domain-containing protein n=1 Tax=Dichotomopilus funicola TaxID=1934379 RepID=A0AAN6ZP07_9PEZI|nr:hypothetical protein C8A04DRAFT_11242 [Dichotomopilus funicola]